MFVKGGRGGVGGVGWGGWGGRFESKYAVTYHLCVNFERSFDMKTLTNREAS